MKYLRHLLIAIDQLVNALLGGWADETLSARAYRQSTRKRHWYWIMRGINALFFWQNNHCRGSHAAEMERRWLPLPYREATKNDL